MAKRDIKLDGFAVRLTYREYLHTAHWHKTREAIMDGLAQVLAARGMEPAEEEPPK